MTLYWSKDTRQPCIQLSTSLLRPGSTAGEDIAALLPETVKSIQLHASKSGYGGEVLSFIDAATAATLRLSYPSRAVLQAHGLRESAVTTPATWTKITRRITMDFIRYWDDQVPDAPAGSDKTGPTLSMSADRGNRDWPPTKTDGGKAWATVLITPEAPTEGPEMAAVTIPDALVDLSPSWRSSGGPHVKGASRTSADKSSARSPPTARGPYVPPLGSTFNLSRRSLLSRTSSRSVQSAGGHGGSPGYVPNPAGGNAPVQDVASLMGVAALASSSPMAAMAALDSMIQQRVASHLATLDNQKQTGSTASAVEASSPLPAMTSSTPMYTAMGSMLGQGQGGQMMPSAGTPNTAATMYTTQGQPTYAYTTTGVPYNGPYTMAMAMPVYSAGQASGVGMYTTNPGSQGNLPMQTMTTGMQGVPVMYMPNQGSAMYVQNSNSQS